MNSPIRFSRRHAALVAVGVSVSLLAAGCASGDSGTGGGEGSKAPLVLGLQSSYTAAGSNPGPAVEAGITARLALENEKGGIDGHEIILEAVDDALDPAKAPAAIRTLVEDENVLAVTISGSASAASVQPYLAENGVLTVPGGPSTQLISPPGSTVRLTKSTYDELAARNVEYAVNELGFEKIGIAFTPDAVGIPARDGAIAELENLGLTPVAVVEYSPGATNADAQVAQLKAAGAEFVIINHIPSVISLVFRSAERINYTPTYGATFAAANPSLHEIMGDSLAGKIIFATSGILPDSDEASDFRKYVESETEASIYDSDVMSGWVAADAQVEVLKKAVADADGEVPTREQVLAAATDIEIDTNYVPGITWSETDYTGPNLSRIIGFEQGGKFVEIDAAKENPIETIVPG